MLLIVNATLYAQTVTIDKFENVDIEDFDEEGMKITADKINAGFTFRLKKSAQLKSAKAKGRGGNFAQGALPPAAEEGDFTVYKGVKLDIPSDRIIEIKVLNDQDVEVTIKLKVVTPAIGTDDPCSITLTSVTTCPPADLGNNFGLLEKDFEKGDIIYVYDFNKITTKRRLYKVSFEWDRPTSTNLFKARKVNMSTEKLKGGQQVWIKLHNVNRFTNEVKLQAVNVNFLSDPSPLLSSFFIGDSTIQSTLIKTFSDKTFAQNVDANKGEIDKMVQAISCFNKMYSDMGKELMKAYDPCAEFFCCNHIDFDKVTDKLNEINSGIALLQLSFTDQQIELNKLKKEKDACSEISENIKKLTARIAELEKLSGAALTTELKDELTNKKADLQKLQECAKEHVDARNDRIDGLTTDLSVLNGLVAIQTKLPKIEEIRSLYVFLENIIEQNQNLMKGPIQLTGNRFDISYEIKSVDPIIKKPAQSPYMDSAFYQIPIVGKPFVSFSSGSFVSVSKYLQNKTYAWQQNVGLNNAVDSGGYTLVESGYSLPVMGFAALANLEWKFNRVIGIGGSAGVGLTIESSPRLAYLGGVSLFLGGERQLAVTGGLSGMQVNRLSKNFQDVADRQVIYPTRDIGDLYYKEFKIGLFISVTYTPFKMSKNN